LAQTVNDGTYQPLSRPLFIYVRADRANDPAVQQFVEFYLNNAGELASEVGYVSLSDEAYQLAGVRVADLLKQHAPADTTAN